MNEQLNRTLALAGVFQAATLVKQLAWKGRLEQPHLETAIHSLFQIDAQDVASVYDGPEKLKVGLQSLTEILKTANTPKDPEIARYTISMLHLERLLMKKPEMLELITQGIDRAKTQSEHFSLTHENVIANLASIYTDTLSTFKFRIHVTGESNYLTNANLANKVRALLLAGIRSAVLWRQLHGSRWHLVFGKKSLIENAKYILANCAEEELAEID